MKNYTRLTKKDIRKQYSLIKSYYKKHLKKFGVVLPKLYDANKKFTKNALTLVYLSIGYPDTKIISKTELTEFIRFFDKKVNDVQ
ncbi:hypothetical protein KKC83_04000 [Patescibacteria group bacterium]|nr:hypothetical protein [Candidatus Falkowbacteria bacterium]MBU3905886.1 hypothetical protein [Patescibacteria group bacterium]MBU4015416.1 hypothetical protein [Patescibacteria group bacterium]MBU4026677.1 hypothetical protein [Patescibacteria group bacterium]MBU4072950.1 hypothetical protein [Patescibacteria group bacterium]